MGAQWLEKNMSLFLDHVVSLAANARATQTHIDAVYTRKCVVYIMVSTVQGMLGEKAQVNAAKELARIINREMDLMSTISLASQILHTGICFLGNICKCSPSQKLRWQELSQKISITKMFSVKFLAFLLIFSSTKTFQCAACLDTESLLGCI